MAFWNKNRTEVTNLPPEYQQYYAAQSGRQRLLRVLFVIATGVIAFVLIILLVAGVRTLMRRRNTGKVAQPVSTTKNGTDKAKPSTGRVPDDGATTTTTKPVSGSAQGNTQPTGTGSTPAVSSGPANLPSTGVDD